MSLWPLEARDMRFLMLATFRGGWLLHEAVACRVITHVFCSILAHRLLFDAK